MVGSPVIPVKQSFIRRNWLTFVGVSIGVVALLFAVYVNLLRPKGVRQPQLAISGDPILVYDPEVTEAFELQPLNLLWQRQSPPRLIRGDKRSGQLHLPFGTVATCPFEGAMSAQAGMFSSR